jgi:dipeptidyl-peptidase 4
MYIWNNGKVTKVTSNGGSSISNGVPDWVYEEEVIEGRSAQWFSPDGEYIVFLSFDDAQIPIYSVPYYMDDHQFPMAYTRQLNIKYPKPGYKNPIVKAYLFKVSDPSKLVEIPLDKAFPIDDSVIGEIAWLTDGHEKLIIRCFNRVQDRDKYLLYEVSSGASKIVRERDGDGGWLDNTKAIHYVGNLGNSSAPNGFYIDLSDKDGWTHIYVYPVDGGDPKQLTSGQWEIRNINSVDKKSGMIFYTSSEHHPTESHIYSVSLITGQKKPLTNPTEAAHWEASFSSNAEYVVLSYLGPNVPYQELYLTNATGPNAQPIRVLEDNAALVTRLKQFALPKTQYMDLAHPSGVKLSAVLRLPPNFAEDKKYPVLLTPYGGPGSQQVRKTFTPPGWQEYVSSDPELEYVTYTVDNRGTGQRGRSFRNFLYKASGTVDVEDQIWAAQELAKQSWVDKDHIGIWGWSNGGYLTLKVVEKGSDIFSFGIATAPTVDDRLYDSIYSERYLGDPAKNKAVWDRAAIRNVTGFKNIAGSVLIQHGTGDDNVHFAHTLGFLDILMAGGVPPEKYQVQPFTDSDHNIRYNKDSEFMYRQLTKKLFDEKNRKPAVEKHQWEVTSDGMKAEEWVKRVQESKNELMDEPILKSRWKTSGTGFDDFIL